MGRRLRPSRGRIFVEGLGGRVKIARDRWGIAYITAQDPPGAWTGLGFCHAQDRAFQMETLRRLATGTLAELAGPRAIPADRLARRVGFMRLARAQLGELDAQALGALDAYREGVGLGLEAGEGRRAHEFSLMRTRPPAWETVEVLAVAKLMAFAMSANWDAELARTRVLRSDGAAALAHVDAEYAAWHPVASPLGEVSGEQIDRLSGDVAALTDALGMSGGSNAWAVAPSRTATGRALLANDPHLPPRLPCPWYLARLDAGEWTAAGATFVGLPALAAGHNGAVAWGITLGLADVSDLYVWSPEAMRSAQTVAYREEIRVRTWRRPLVDEAVVTPRGPVISRPSGGGGPSISLRATWMEPLPIGGLLRAPAARSCAELRAAFGEWPLMPLNVVFADVSGAIGWQLAGDVPVRRSGHGTLPSPGWTRHGDWEPDPVPYAEMPGESDPPLGFVVSANQRPAPEGVGPFLGVDWADGLRAARIAEALSGSDSWDVDSAADLQLDQLSLQWGEVRDAVLAIRPLDGASARAIEMLGEWDGVVSPGSAAACIFEALMLGIDLLDVLGHAPEAGRYIVGEDVVGLGVPNMLAFRRAGRLSRLLREGGPGHPPGQWEQLLSRALAEAMRNLAGRLGRDPDRWAWGRARPMTLLHPVGRLWPLAGVFDVGPIDFGGDTNTVAQAAAGPLDPLANPMVIPSMRCVIDVGDFSRSTYSLAGGQSGNPLSPNYRDLVGPWLAGRGVPVAWSASEVESAAVDELRLVPAEVLGGGARG